MAKRKQPDPPSGAPEWMATYSDLVTLLFSFFVLLYALSTADQTKIKAFSDSFAGRPTSILDNSSSSSGESIMEMMGSGIMDMPIAPEVSSDFDEQDALEASIQTSIELGTMASDFKTYFAENNMMDQANIVVEANSVLISFKDGILFDVGKADLKSSAINTLDLLTDKIMEYPDNVIRITGHTDNIPINVPQFPSNWYLSAARAISVGVYFIDVKGFDPDLIEQSGRGEYQPIDTNDTHEGRAKNRRVEIRIMSSAYNNSDY